MRRGDIQCMSESLKSDAARPCVSNGSPSLAMVGFKPRIKTFARFDRNGPAFSLFEYASLYARSVFL